MRTHPRTDFNRSAKKKKRKTKDENEAALAIFYFSSPKEKK